MVAFGINSQVSHCRRGSPRQGVMLAGSALAVTRSRSVAVSDLSLDGAALGGRDLPPPGDDVLMIVGPVERMATVMWRRGDHIGIRFDDPLCEDNVAAMKSEAAWASVTGWTN
jgi:hypothetical protein